MSLMISNRTLEMENRRPKRSLRPSGGVRKEVKHEERKDLERHEKDEPSSGSSVDFSDDDHYQPPTYGQVPKQASPHQQAFPYY